MSESDCPHLSFLAKGLPPEYSETPTPPFVYRFFQSRVWIYQAGTTQFAQSWYILLSSKTYNTAQLSSVRPRLRGVISDVEQWCQIVNNWRRGKGIVLRLWCTGLSCILLQDFLHFFEPLYCIHPSLYVWWKRWDVPPMLQIWRDHSDHTGTVAFPWCALKRSQNGRWCPTLPEHLCTRVVLKVALQRKLVALAWGEIYKGTSSIISRPHSNPLSKRD